MRTAEQLHKDASAIIRLAEWRQIKAEEFIGLLGYVIAKMLAFVVTSGIMTREEGKQLAGDLHDEICGVIDGEEPTVHVRTRH